MPQSITWIIDSQVQWRMWVPGFSVLLWHKIFTSCQSHVGILMFYTITHPHSPSWSTHFKMYTNKRGMCIKLLDIWYNSEVDDWSHFKERDHWLTWWRHQNEILSALLAFVWGIHQLPVNSHHKGQWRGALMFSLICGWTNGWVNNGDAGDLRRHRAHYDVTVMVNLR